MEITTFNPVIVSDKANDYVALFEELGFEKRHAPDLRDHTAAEQDFRLKDASGHYVDVTLHTGYTKDLTLIRMNVRNFDEAYEILTRHGFKNKRGDATLDINHAKSATMVSESGLMIALVEHQR
jgi:hypothetical protein